MTASKQQTIADTARRLFREHGFSAVPWADRAPRPPSAASLFTNITAVKTHSCRKLLPSRKTASVPNLKICLNGNAACAKPPRLCLPCKDNRLRTLFRRFSARHRREHRFGAGAVFPRIERRKIRFLCADSSILCSNAA